LGRNGAHGCLRCSAGQRGSHQDLADIEAIERFAEL
jgi:hypothetical protein